MSFSQFILAVNAGSIFILIIFALLLLIATKFKGQYGYAAAIIALTTVPAYLYNICRSEMWYGLAEWFSPLAFSVNALLMPLLWMFVKHNFDKSYRFGWKQFPHFLPAVILFIGYCIYYFLLFPDERLSEMVYENSGKDGLLGTINSVVIFTQMFSYFTAIFIYLFRVRRYVGDHFSLADWNRKLWIFKFIVLIASFFVIVFVCYILWPRTDTWLLQILNVSVMSYLMYGSIVNSQTAQLEDVSLKEIVRSDKNSQEDLSRLKEYAAAAQQYLISSEAYLNPDFSIKDLSRATGISANNLSKAINSTLNRNFFELINKMRCEKAKTLLRDYQKSKLTMDAIALQCGFNSRFTLNSSFKRYEGTSPYQWLKGVLQ